MYALAALLSAGYESTAGLSMSPGAPPWQGRSIASSKLRMLEFSAFLEQPQDPETVSWQDVVSRDQKGFNTPHEAIYLFLSSLQSSCTPEIVVDICIRQYFPYFFFIRIFFIQNHSVATTSTVNFTLIDLDKMKVE